MVEKILGEQSARAIFLSSMLSNLMTEKQASEMSSEIMKCAAGKDKFDIWKLFKRIGAALGVASGAAKHGWDAVATVPKILGLTALVGAGTGALGAYATDSIKSLTSKEDPEVKFKTDVEAYYKKKRKELEDSRWMSRVTKMRDELRREYRKMSPEEYSDKYNKLVNALDERA